MGDAADLANEKTEFALQAEGCADMRPAYRELLRRLRKDRPAAFQEATRRHAELLVPSIASDSVDPLVAWIDYGAWLAAQTTPGRVVRLDATGLAAPAGDHIVRDQVILFLPEDASERAIALACPKEPSQPQRAAIDLLVT